MRKFTTVIITSNNAKIRTGASSAYTEILGSNVRKWDTKYHSSQYKNGYYYIDKIGGWVSKADVIVLMPFLRYVGEK